MKKIMTVILSLILILLITACGKGEIVENADKNVTINNEILESNKDSNSTVLEDESAADRITLYFSDKDVMFLVPEDREVKKVTGVIIVKELINGPKNPDLVGVIPEGVEVLGVSIKDNIAYVDLNKVFTEKVQGSTGETFAVYSIVNSITANKTLGVSKVQILIEGSKVETVAGHLDTSGPLEPNLNMIAK